MNIDDLLIFREGVHDPHIFKAVFMIGGPGSGKTYVANKLFKHTGLRFINMDIVYDHIMKDIATSAYDDEIRGHSARVMQRKMNTQVDGRLGLLIDATGRNMKRLVQQIDAVKKLGYDTMGIFINTDEEIALTRAEERTREVKLEFTLQARSEIADNMNVIRGMFDSFVIIDNNDNESLNNSIAQHGGKITRFLESPPKKKEAIQWISKNRR